MSGFAFEVVRYAGAAYLIALGIRALRRDDAGGSTDASRTEPVATRECRRILRDACVVALLNPKTTLFFAAFLPQFIRPGASPMLQSIVLGALFVAIAACTDSAYALGASALAPWLARRRGATRLGRRMSGWSFIGLGVFGAIAGSRSQR